MKKINSTITTLVSAPEISLTEVVSAQALNEKLAEFNAELNETLTSKLTAQQAELDKANQTIASLKDEVGSCRVWLQHLFDYYARFKTLDPVVEVYRIPCETSAKKLFQPKYCYHVLFSFLTPDGSIHETWLTTAQFFGSVQFFRKPRVKVVRWSTEYITIKLNGKETIYNYKGEILDTDWCLPSLITQ